MKTYDSEIEPIKQFKGDYGFLSNFYEVDIQHGGREFPTVEHAYQAAKTHDPQMRMVIQGADTPALAKKMGRDVELRPNWNRIKVQIMEDLLEKKFEKPELREKLIKTYPARLLEGNDWGDDFWGVTENGEGQGRNQLGKLLMQIRYGAVQEEEVDI